MSDGAGCKCRATCRSECVCDADWTPREVIELRQQLAALREENERLRRALDTSLDALSKARRDIKEHLQVAKWNLKGEVTVGETVEPPTMPSLIHQSGIDASERVIAEIERAMKIGIGTIGVPTATGGESEVK